MKTMFHAGFTQDFFRMGNGGRGGRAFTYEWDDDERYRYCDPATEDCPIPLVSPVMAGNGKGELSCGPECDCGDELGCKKCQDGRRKKKRRQADNIIPDTSTMPESTWNLRGPLNGVRHELGHRALGQTCPVSAPASWPADLNCQRDGRGNAVCSNGMYFPPGCPHTPPDEYFSPGIAPDELRDGALQAKIPPPRTAGTPSGSSPVTPSAAPSAVTIAAGVGVLGAVGTALYFILRR